MKQNNIAADSLLTSYQVGDLLQMNPSSINKWVKDGRIPAFRTPGGHHRIRASDLVVFLDAHKMPVPRTLANAGRRRLLIVDDDAKQLAAFERVFRPYSARVDLLVVPNGIDALVQVGTFKPHAIVLDIFMPNLDGIEVCTRLGQLADTGSTKIIIASARLTPELEQQAHEAGAVLCLQKPIDVSKLLEVLDVGELANVV